MPTLDLYKQRKFSFVKLSNGIEYKIPNEYNVEEVERMLEIEKQRESVEKEPADNPSEQFPRFWKTAFDQLEVIFQHYQPEVTSDFLRTVISHQEALAILGFYDKYRFIKAKEGEVDDEKGKKKR